MNTRRIIGFSIILVLLIPGVLATGEYEDFEDDTDGANPTASWYTYTEAGNTFSSVTSPGLAGSDLKYSLTGGSPTEALFEFALDEYSEFQFDTTGDNQFGTGTQIFTICEDPGGDNQCNDVGEIINQMQWQFTSTTYTVTGCGTTLINSETHFVEHTIKLGFDWVLNEISCYVDDSFVASTPYTHTVTGFGSLWMISIGSPPGALIIDNLILDGGPSIGEPPDGVFGELTKTATNSTTGKLQLAWTLSPDDPDQEVGQWEYEIYENGILVNTDSIDSQDGNGIRTYTHHFTGNGPFGTSNFTIKAKDGLFRSNDSCQITIDLDTIGSTDSCGSTVLGASPTEFVSGLESTLESVGIITVQSKMLFTLIVVGVSTVGMAGALRLMAPGRMKNYVILAIPVMLALLMIFMDFLTPWEFIVALVLGVFATLRMSVFQNTYHEIRDRIRADRERAASGVDATPRMMQLAGRLFPNLSKRQQIDALRNELQDPDREDSLAATRFPFHPREESRRRFREELESDEEADPR